MRPALHVLAIGGEHQFGHFLPVAFELERRGRLDVSIFVPDVASMEQLLLLAERLELPLPRTIAPSASNGVNRLVPPSAKKLVKLAAWSRHIRSDDLVLCAERTSTILKRIPGWRPRVVHIPHGAGDRAKGFERRFSLFDLVIVAGQKDRDRLIAEQVVRPERCVVSGSVKVAMALRAEKHRGRLFENDRPVVLYNPHFSRRLSSSARFLEPLVQAIVNDGRYNLVVAPHVRMARNWSRTRRARWEAMSIDDRIIVDLGSQRSVDMTYTLGSDVYVGDVSSQVYEFLLKPRPCVFLNAHNASWQASEDYAMWRFGEVVTRQNDIIAALDRSLVRHDEFLPLQKQRVRMAFDGVDWDGSGEVTLRNGDPVAKAADLVEAFAFRHAHSL